MLSFKSLKPKQYSVQVLKDTTSQTAVRRIKRARAKTPFKKLATIMLTLSFIVGGLASASAATAVTAKQAEANIFADLICIKAGEDNSGSWSGGANLYGPIGGRSMMAGMYGIGKHTAVNDAAFMGISGTWGGFLSPSDGQYLTAYEKYGLLYPVYDAWIPVYTDKQVTISQVDTSTGSYSTADGKLPLKGGNILDPGVSPLTTSNIGSCLAFFPAVSAGIATIISALPRFVMGAGIEIFGATYGSSISQTGSPLYLIGQAIDKFITQPGGLRDSLFIPFVLPLILIGAIWVGYVGIVKRATRQALLSTVWMVVAIAAGTVFLAKPTLISSFVDTTVAEVQRVVNEAVLSGSQANDMCNIQGSGDPKATIRETKCTIWHSTIYTSWVAGQFGEGANSSNAQGSVLTQEAGRDVLGTDTYKVYYGSSNGKHAATWPQFMIDRQATTKGLELSEVAWSQLSGQGGAAINRDWNGSLNMISSSILMFFGAGASSAVLFVYGFVLLIYQLTMVVAVLMSPFFFLFGIVPNWGRRILMRYAEILANLAIKRIITAALLAFYLIFYNLIVGDAGILALLLKIMLIFALALFFITARGKFVKMFADNINFGGNKSVGLPGGKVAAVAAGLGAGIFGGGIVGAMIVGSKVNKANKDIQGNVKDIKLEGGSPTADIKGSPKGSNTAGKDNGGTNPVKTVAKTAGKAVGTARDAMQAKEMLDKVRGKGGNASAGGPSKPPPARPKASPARDDTPTPAQSSPAQNNAPAGPQTSSMPSPVKQAGRRSAAPPPTTGGAGPKVAPPGAPPVVPPAVVPAAAPSGIVGAGAAAPAAAAPVAAAVPAAAAPVAAASTGVAAGGAAAAGGGVVAGAAAGSVVPVIGTVIGAAAGAAVVGIKKKKEAEEAAEREGGSN